MLLHLGTTNDSNGNPRRGWAHFNDRGIITAFYEEGYHGYNALPEELRELRLAAPHIEVAPREYRKWVKAGQANSKEA